MLTLQMQEEETLSSNHGLASQRDRAWRRAKQEKAKTKAKRVLKQWHHMHVEDPETIGHMASTGCKPCSCPMCGNPRRHFKQLTVQERRMENAMDRTDF
jgi:hypothetical protein